MLEITPAAGRVIADDTVAAFSATDEALLIRTRFTLSVLEGTAASGMHPRTKQKLLDTINKGQANIIEARRNLVDAHAQLLVIQKHSNLDVYDWGCWKVVGDVIFGSADEKAHPVMEKSEAPQIAAA